MKTAGHGRKAKQAAILEALKEGNTRRAACAVAGIPHITFYRWLDDDTFCACVEKAEAEAEIERVQIIKRAAEDGSWQAAAWWLERKLEEWRRRDQIDFKRLPDEELIARAKGAFVGDGAAWLELSAAEDESPALSE